MIGRQTFQFLKRIVCVATELPIDPLSQPKSFARQHIFDFHQAGLSEISVRKQLGFADFQKISQSADIHLFETIPGSDRELKISDWSVQHRVEPSLISLCVLVK